MLRYRPRTALKTLGLLAVLGIVCASTWLACSSAEPTADLSDIAIDAGATSSVNSGSPADDNPLPRSGGTLRVLLGCFDSLDPAVGDCHELYDEVYARLTSITDDPSNPIELDLAESYSVSYDGTAYTFVLERDLKFSDGSPLSAQDFKWSWERALNPETGSDTALDVLGGIVGAEEVAAGDTDTLSGVSFADDRTLIVELTAPRPLFLYEIADHVAAPLNRSNVEKWQVDFTDQGPSGAGQVSDVMPVGTGPFRVSEYGIEGGSGVRLEANPHYHPGRPLLDAVVFVPLEVMSDSTGQVDAAATMLAMFEAGEIDISPFATRDTQTLSGTNFERSLADGVAFLAFNTSIEPLDDLHVRRAIVAASNVTESQSPDAAYSLLWDGLPRYDPDVAIDRYGLEVARRELELSNSGNLESFGTLLMCSWNNLGGGLSLKADVTDLIESWKSELEFEIAERDMRPDQCLRDAAIVSVYIEPPFPDPHAVIAPVASLFADWEDDSHQAVVMLREAAGAADTVARLASYADIESYLFEQALVLPLFRNFTTITEHIRNTVRGYEPGRYGGSVYSSVWLDDSTQ